MTISMEQPDPSALNYGKDNSTNDMGAILHRWKTEAVNFTENTTAHGLERVGKNHRPIWYRLLWLTLVLAGMTVAITNCNERIRRFLSHPFQMVETLEPQANIPFPSVTVCNAFPLPVLGQSYTESRDIIDEVKRSTCYNVSAEREHIADKVGVSEEALLFSVLDGNIRDIGFSSQSLVANCRFGSQKCTHEQFIWYEDSDHFNCYTFTTKELASRSKELTLLLYLSTYGRPYNYTDVLESFTAGAYVQVHEPNVLPSPMKKGVVVSPGTFNLLSLITYKTELLAEPVATNCTNRTLASTPYKYNVDVCYKVCLQEMMVRYCGCAFTGIHIEKPQDYTGPFCFQNYCNKTLLNIQTQCVADFYANLNLDVKCLECKMPPCLSWDYFDRHSMLEYFVNFPADDFAEDFLDVNHSAIADMKEAYGNLTNVPKNFVSKNFAKVTVTFSDLHVRHRVAEKTMSGFSLFSDLGGAFGFWIGCSIMTFVEFIEWLIRTAISTANSNKNQVVTFEQDSE